MQFFPTEIPGVVLAIPAPVADSRGEFTRVWCRQEFLSAGLDSHVEQINSVTTRSAGTIRGLHYQADPYGEAKTIRCTRGEAYVIVVDIRSSVPTFRRHLAVRLSAENGRILHVPQGFAQGYQTLVDDTEMMYCMSTAYVQDAARGFRYDDPAFAIDWPLDVTHVSDRDLNWQFM